MACTFVGSYQAIEDTERQLADSCVASDKPERSYARVSFRKMVKSSFKILGADEEIIKVNRTEEKSRPLVKRHGRGRRGGSRKEGVMRRSSDSDHGSLSGCFVFFSPSGYCRQCTRHSFSIFGVNKVSKCTILVPSVRSSSRKPHVATHNDAIEIIATISS